MRILAFCLGDHLSQETEVPRNNTSWRGLFSIKQRQHTQLTQGLHVTLYGLSRLYLCTHTHTHTHTHARTQIYVTIKEKEAINLKDSRRVGYLEGLREKREGKNDIIIL
jgi:hypothetical protein